MTMVNSILNYMSVDWGKAVHYFSESTEGTLKGMSCSKVSESMSLSATIAINPSM